MAYGAVLLPRCLGSGVPALERRNAGTVKVRNVPPVPTSDQCAAANASWTDLGMRPRVDTW